MDWQAWANIAAVFGAISGGAASFWLFLQEALKRRKEADRRLSVRIERPSSNNFQVVVEYRPESLNQGLFAEIGSLGANPIYLLPRMHPALPREILEKDPDPVTWPKTTGQWVGGRLRPVEGSEILRARFRVVPQSTDAGGWLHVRICTQTPNRRTLMRRRIPVSVINAGAGF